MQVRVALLTDRQVWDTYLSTQRNAEFYQLYDWKDVFEKAFGCETRYLLAETRAGIIGVLPLFIVKKYVIGGGYISSLPGSICTDEKEAAQKLVNAAIGLAEETGARYLSLRDGNQKLQDERLKTRIEYTYVLDDLPSDPDILWKKVKSNVRTPVRKARNKGLTTNWGKEHLAGFYRVYARNMRDLGTPAIPKSFFKEAAEQFPNKVHLLTIDFSRQIIGGMFLFAFGDILSNPFASSLREYFDLCPNDLLYWTAIEYACHQGYREFNMGRSTKDSGPARFKEKYLAKPREIFYQYYLNTSTTISAPRVGKTYRVGSSIWKHLPLSIANILSKTIRRVVPMG